MKNNVINIFYSLSLLLVYNLGYTSNLEGYKVSFKQKNDIFLLDSISNSESKLSNKISKNIDFISINDHLFYPSGEISRIESFYNLDKNKVYDQKSLPWCSIFALSSAISYKIYEKTKAISPLYLMFNIMKSGDINNSGIVGVTDVNVFKKFTDYINSGVYNVNHKNEILILEKIMEKVGKIQYEKGNKDPLIFFSELEQTPEFKTIKENYNLIDKIDNSEKALFSQINIKVKEVNLNGQSQTKSQIIKDLLDKNEVIVLDITIFGDSNDLESYKYSLDKKILEPSEENLQNTWHKIKGKKANGGHVVFVVGYFVDKSGNLMFLLRNSWGEEYGDRGNYYATDKYIDNALQSAIIIT